MRIVHKAFFVLLIATAGSIAQSAHAGIIQGASGTPNPITAGNTYTLTVTGSNSGGFLCQGLNIDWGDGASSTPGGGVAFPHVTTHLYGPVASSTVRTINITPSGGECAGSATTTVIVNPAPGVISSITGPATAVRDVPMSITVNGTGLCGSMNINWGEGLPEPVNNYNLASPTAINHTYTGSGPKTVTVTGTASCSGSVTHNLTVSDPPGVVSTINGAVTATQNAPYTITVSGTDICGVMVINWGDGGSPETINNYNLTTSVPIPHSYMNTGSKTITVTGTPNCSGNDTHHLTVNPPPVGPGVISAINGPSTVYRDITSNWTVSGTGTCGSMSIVWGDGDTDSANNYNLVSPINLPHKYPTLGSKTIDVSGTPSCSGNASKTVIVTNFIRPDWLDRIRALIEGRFIYRVPCLAPPCPFGPRGPFPPSPCLSCPRIFEHIKQEDATRAKLLVEARQIIDQVNAGKLKNPVQIRNAQARLSSLAMALEESDKRRGWLVRSFDAEAAKTKLKPATVPQLQLQRVPVQQVPVKQVPEKKVPIK